MISAHKHTAAILKHLRGITPEIVLFYSGGKDSLVLLDMLSKHFDRVHCVFMYFVPDLAHLQPYINWVKRYDNAILHQLPHWMVAYYMKHGYYSFHKPQGIKGVKQADIERMARKTTGCDWLIFGHKQADSMNRRLMLRGYKYDAFNEAGQKVYPLSLWTKDQVKRYISLKKIIQPIQYSAKNSSGLDLTLDVFLWLRENAPADLEKIYKVFPLSKQILFEYDYQQQNQ